MMTLWVDYHDYCMHLSTFCQQHNGYYDIYFNIFRHADIYFVMQFVQAMQKYVSMRIFDLF